MPPLAPLVSDPSEVETYGLRYGRLAPGSMRQIPTAESGLKRSKRAVLDECRRANRRLWPSASDKRCATLISGSHYLDADC